MNSARALIFVVMSLAIVAIAECQEEEKTTSTENTVEQSDTEVRVQANTGKQSRQDAKVVAGMMLEQVGLPFLAWPTFGIIKDAAKSLFSVGKRGKVPVVEEDDYDYEQASIKSNKAEKLNAKHAKN